jgi:hypothetical protein
MLNISFGLSLSMFPFTILPSIIYNGGFLVVSGGAHMHMLLVDPDLLTESLVCAKALTDKNKKNISINFFIGHRC